MGDHQSALTVAHQPGLTHLSGKDYTPVLGMLIETLQPRPIVPQVTTILEEGDMETMTGYQSA